jgi:hypothetical protein
MTRKDMRDRDLMQIAESILGWGDDAAEMSDALLVQAALEAAYEAGRRHQKQYGGNPL